MSIDSTQATHTAAHSREAPLDGVFTTTLDQHLRQAQSRLIRIARSYRISLDAVDDIVQETCIRAWRNLDQIRSPDRFDSWLDAICRNQCRMYLRAQQSACRYINQPSWSARYPTQRVTLDDVLAGVERQTVPHALAPDPYDELERRELTDLLGRALRCLPPRTRAALELRYLQDHSLAEIAAAQETTAAVQETRLRRARARLRETLLGPLRDDTVAFGLASVPTEDERLTRWQTTRITCYLCGRRALEGRFEPVPNLNGHRELRLRCPVCSRQHGIDVFRSKGLASLDDLSAIRPALTRSMRALNAHAQRVLASGHDVCLHCGAPVQRQIVTPQAFPDALPASLLRHWLVAPCPRAGCPGLGAWPATDPAWWSDPEPRRFMARHPRWRLAPEEDANWQGRPAILVKMIERDGAARLSVFVDCQTLRVLASVSA